VDADRDARRQPPAQPLEHLQRGAVVATQAVARGDQDDAPALSGARR